MGRRRRRLSLKFKLILWSGIAYVGHWGYEEAIKWYGGQDKDLLLKYATGAATLITLLIVWKITSKIKRYRSFRKALGRGVSTNIKDYRVKDSNFNRDNRIDRKFRKLFLLKMLDIHGNQCANCGDSSNGLDVDHFIFPKSQGGNFIMIHKDGFYVSNAIPLCITCNRSKSDRDFRKFFTDKNLRRILEINKELTKHLNEEMDQDGKKAA